MPSGGRQSQQISDRCAPASATSEARTVYFVAPHCYLSKLGSYKTLLPSKILCLRPHQISFKANWICLEVVTVEVIAPAPASRAPVLSKRALLSTGGEKFGWLKILKTSTRNCALRVSDILLNLMFLNRDISKLISPGPVN